MSANELIRFIECVNNIKSSWMTFDEALRNLEYCENIKANRTGLRKIEAHWNEVLENRIAQANK
jgi:hypothetical protein